MTSSHTPTVADVHHAEFDEENLIAHAGAVPVMDLAKKAGLAALADEFLTVPTDKGSNAGAKTMAMVAGIVMGADSFDDMETLRAGATGKAFGFTYAPSTLGQFARKSEFGHVRQMDAVASRLLTGLSGMTGLLGSPSATSTVMVDVDDTLVEVYGRKKQGAGVGYTKKRGLNVLLGVASADSFAPAVLAQRLRRGPANSARGAERLVADSLAAVGRTHLAGRPVLLRADSAYYNSKVAEAARRAGAHVSVTVRTSKRVRAAIASVPEDGWTTIKYPRAVWDEQAGRWVSEAEVAEVRYTAFKSKAVRHRVEGRLVVRRVPEANPEAKAGQDVLFQMYRYHAFFTTAPAGERGTVEADRVHRAHAVIEQADADLKGSGLAHMPSGKFNANGVWLDCSVMAFNLTRAAATLTGSREAAVAETATVRARLVQVPARLATSGRRLSFHLPAGWRWERWWLVLWERVRALPAAPLGASCRT
jgi:hypothetical protein